MLHRIEEVGRRGKGEKAEGEEEALRVHQCTGVLTPYRPHKGDRDYDDFDGEHQLKRGASKDEQ